MNEVSKMNMLLQAFVEKKKLTPSELRKKLECGRHTIYRTLVRAKSEYGIPIEYDPVEKVYRFEDDQKYSLPLIWFTPKDVMVLLTLLEAFRELPFGIVDSEITPFKERLEKIVNTNPSSLNLLLKSIRILPTHFRRTPKEALSTLCTAISSGKKVKMKYKDRQNENVTERVVSPLQLVRYRDNWYLDAYCHRNDDLRIFSVDRIQEMEILKTKAKKVGKKVLQEFYRTSYGIFAGKPKNKVVLKFSPQISKWVASEEWHPEQKSSFDKNGFYILEFPYSDERELTLDILRYGDDVEVKSPPSLRDKIKEKLKKAYQQYQR